MVSLGIRQYFESPYRPKEIITVDEYYQWIFENSVPGLPEAAAKEGLTPLAYMRKYGVFELKKENYIPFEKSLHSTLRGWSDLPTRMTASSTAAGAVVGVKVDDQFKVGFDTPSRKLEFFSDTLSQLGLA